MEDFYLAYQSLIAFVGINSLLALSVYATLSCGQLSLANAGFMAIGAYTGALLTLHSPEIPFAFVLIASAVLPAVVAVPLGLPVLRLRGVFLAIATIGFGEVVRLAKERRQVRRQRVDERLALHEVPAFHHAQVVGEARHPALAQTTCEAAVDHVLLR